MKQDLLQGSNEGSWGLASDKGWMTLEVFFEWFKWFVAQVKPTEDSQVLLLLDGHSSHTKNSNVIDYARKNYVTILCFPPHCSHKLQPLDVSIMKPLSDKYTQQLKTFAENNIGQVISEKNIAQLFSAAFRDAAKEKSIKNGFRKTGIWPFNRNIFPLVDFAPADVTNRSPPESPSPPPEEETNWEMLSQSLSGLSVENPPTSSLSPTHLLPPTDSEKDDSPKPSTSGCQKACQRESRIMSSSESSSESSDGNLRDCAASRTVKNKSLRKLCPRGTLKEKAVWKNKKFDVPIQQIKPLAKINANTIRKTSRRAGRAEIMTTRAYRQELEDSQKAKEKNTNKRKKIEKKKLPEKDLSDGDESDADCLYCFKKYSESHEVWIQCRICEQWAHTSCAGVCSINVPEIYECDSCNNSKTFAEF